MRRNNMMNKFKLITLSILSVLVIDTLVGCGNKTLIDTTYTFDKAIIKLQNGELIEGNVQNWRDYDDGDQIQVTINDVTYLVHSSNVTLISE